MYGTTPGFYLLVGPNWQGEVPKGITKVFRSPTNTGFGAPRVFQDDTPEDKNAIQSVLPYVLFYPLSEFDGTMKAMDWANLPKAPAQVAGDEESKWVFPEKFVDQLPAVLADAPPLPGEEARYAQVLAVLEAAKKNPNLKAAITSAAAEAEEQLVKPLFQFRNYGQQLPHHWSTISNEAASVPTTSRAPRWRNQTSSSIHPTKRNTSTRISTRAARVSKALTATP
jgi:hypothetical protein